MLNNLGERCNKILDFLLHSTDYISMRELAEKTNVSRRSVYYDICNINDWLDSNNLPPLKILRGKGIFISPAEKISINALIDKRTTATNISSRRANAPKSSRATSSGANRPSTSNSSWRLAKSAAIQSSATFRF